MRKAIFPGSFDPVTNGHMDIISRAAGMFDTLVVGVFKNVRKQSFLPVEGRIQALREATADIANVEVVSFDGLLPDYMKTNDIKVIVRGLRSVTDYEYEQGQAQIIHQLNPELDTIFFLTKPEFSCVSSSMIREIYHFNGGIAPLVPKSVITAIEYFSNK